MIETDMLVIGRALRGGSDNATVLVAEDTSGTVLTLNVFIENSHARTLYERTGFVAKTVRYVKDLRSSA
jgi:hypothetical protein